MKDETPFLFGIALFILIIGMAAGFFIGRVRGAEGLPSWIDKQARLVSHEGKPYRLVECEYVEKKEVKK